MIAALRKLNQIPTHGASLPAFLLRNAQGLLDGTLALPSVPVGLALDTGHPAAFSASCPAFIGVHVLGVYERRAVRIPTVRRIGRGELDSLSLVFVDCFLCQESPGSLEGDVESAATWWEERGVGEGMVKERLDAPLTISVGTGTLNQIGGRVPVVAADASFRFWLWLTLRCRIVLAGGVSERRGA